MILGSISEKLASFFSLKEQTFRSQHSNVGGRNPTMAALLVLFELNVVILILYKKMDSSFRLAVI